MIRKVLFATTAALALVGLTAAPSSAQYEPDVASLNVDKAQVAQGDCLTLSGTDFDADTTYEIGVLFDGTTDDSTRALPNTETSQDLGTVTTDADGAFAEVLAIEADAPLGLYTIGIDTEIVEEDGGFTNIATVSYEVIAGDGTSDCADNGGTTTTTTPGNGNGNGNGNGGTNNGNQPGTNNGTLPRTGSSTLPLVGAGLGLLATGGGLLLLNKRRSIA